jgi:hypothetical protein
MTWMNLKYVRTEGAYDFFTDFDRKIFNIVPKGLGAPMGGYAVEYILKVKLNREFATRDEAVAFFLGVVKGRVYKNVNFKKRDYNCTNVVAVEILVDGKTPPGFYDNYGPEEVDLNKLTALYVQDGVKYWGYL